MVLKDGKIVCFICGEKEAPEGTVVPAFSEFVCEDCEKVVLLPKHPMTFAEYETKAAETAVYPNRGANAIYPFLGLAGEAGEVCEKLKKLIRDNQEPEFGYQQEPFLTNIKKELGDVLWYVAAICFELGISMEDVAKGNLEKLASRKDRNVIRGNGDDR